MTFSANPIYKLLLNPALRFFLMDSLRVKQQLILRVLIIENLSAGTYTIKVVKEGFTPQEENISLKSGVVFMYTVKP